ncbi:hypothetical protein AVEN_34792-1, partial [Araneus ventricosus]
TVSVNGGKLLQFADILPDSKSYDKMKPPKKDVWSTCGTIYQTICPCSVVNLWNYISNHLPLRCGQPV